MSKPTQVSFSDPVLIEKLVPGGQGLATLPDGKKAFFWNALPGEHVVECEITKKKSKYVEAVSTKTIDSSPYRIDPKDLFYLSTSPWQILNYDYELAQKRELLIESLRQEGIVGKLQSDSAVQVAPVKTDNHDYFYRNKMEYSLYYDHDDTRIHLAFHRRGSHAKIPIAHSSIERPEILRYATDIVNDLNARGEEARKYQSLLLRCDQNGHVSGGLYENGQPHPIFKNLTDTILDREYSYSPNGFFQINLPVYAMALKEIKKHISTDDVLDLYAGVGTIGLSVAYDKNLTLVEVNQAAYAEMVKNCKGEPSHASAQPTSHTKNSPTAVLAKSEEALEYIKSRQTVILDPPRAGIDLHLTNRLLEVLPETIIYLSCNPATQARDLRLLTMEHKYHIIKIQPFNFFPRTPHLENLVVLHRS